MYDGGYGAGAQARAQQEQFGSNPEFAQQYGAGVNVKAVERAAAAIKTETERITITQIKDIQTSVINPLIKGWCTPDGKQHIELYAETLNTLTANIVRTVTSICTQLKETGEEYSKNAFNVSSTINIEAPSRELIHTAGAKECADDGTVFVIEGQLTEASKYLINTVMPTLETTMERIKNAAKGAGLYDNEASLQASIDSAVASMSKSITEAVVEIVKKINESVDAQTESAQRAKAEGQARLAAMNGVTW